MSDTFAILVLLICLDVAGGAIAGGCLRWLVRHDWSDPDWFWALRQHWPGGPPFADMLAGFILIVSIPPFLGAVVFAGTKGQSFMWLGLLLYVGSLAVGSLTPDSVAARIVPMLAGGFLMVVGAVLFVTLADTNLLGALFALAALGGLGGYVFVTSAFRAPRS